MLLFNGCFRFVKTANFAFENLIHWVKTFVNVDSTPKHLFCLIQALFFRDIVNYIFEHSSKLKDCFFMLKFCPRRGFVCRVLRQLSIVLLWNWVYLKQNSWEKDFNKQNPSFKKFSSMLTLWRYHYIFERFRSLIGLWEVSRLSMLKL